jgi:hypothetical protein
VWCASSDDMCRGQSCTASNDCDVNSACIRMPCCGGRRICVRNCH